MSLETDNNTFLASQAFSAQSAVFDKLYAENKLTCHMRVQFRETLLRYLRPGARLLELNCGTGTDALFFAEKGFEILATDNADGMLRQISQKIKDQKRERQVAVRKCDFEELDDLQPLKFDHIYSNFSGLNCTAHLDKVLLSLAPLLHPQGMITLVLMPRICPWELIMMLKGDFKTAFRRFRNNGAEARIENRYFQCYYYSPAYVKHVLKAAFRVISVKGMAITAPPPFIENFVERYPRLFKMLSAIDKGIGNRFPFNRCCDQYIITMQKK